MYARVICARRRISVLEGHLKGQGEPRSKYARHELNTEIQRHELDTAIQNLPVQISANHSPWSV